MIKKYNNTGLVINRLKQPVILNKHPTNKDIANLFDPPRRELFQLDYLYKSPHAQHYPDYIEILKILEQFNQQTQQIQANCYSHLARNQNILIISSIRFIYREMLSISVMQDKEVKQNNYAGKLKNWYYGLTDKHSFLEGVNFKKRKIQHEQLDELIRKSYVSNVYDEINDYFRKQTNYADTILFKENDSHYKKSSEQSINLPFIDTQLYKREIAIMRNYRQKRYEDRYLEEMKRTKATIKEVSLKHRESKLLNRTKGAKTYYKSQEMATIPNENQVPTKSKLTSIHQSNYKSFFKQYDKFPGLQLAYAGQEQTQIRSSLASINGINLIQEAKYQ